VARAIESIRAGDSYQVNLSQAFHAERRGEAGVDAQAVALYRSLRARTPATMGALIQAGPQRWLISNSPETLFEITASSSLSGEVEISSWPIKGTRPRHADAAADERAAAELLASNKDLAEHIMIVDLVRNDLGRVAKVGSVHVEGPPALTSLPTVHHLVSRVGATLPKDWSLASLFTALFPGGSITGAPKRRTCEIIEELEGEARGIYCGAIFVLQPNGAHVSIPIRTGELSPEGFEIRSGGGIVVDSQPEDERLETLAKARAFDPLGGVCGPAGGHSPQP
jgi:anthranilate/para-aminobenzoate synthase component I